MGRRYAGKRIGSSLVGAVEAWLRAAGVGVVVAFAGTRQIVRQRDRQTVEAETDRDWQRPTETDSETARQIEGGS